jgi:hypothetical protein
MSQGIAKHSSRAANKGLLDDGARRLAPLASVEHKPPQHLGLNNAPCVIRSRCVSCSEWVVGK